MSADLYYDPPGPVREREGTFDCDACEAETLHAEVLWSTGAATRECLTCGDVTDIEGDD